MAYETEHKTSAQLQREIELQRDRVENTIDQIQEKLSPGQLVDELLAYTKGGGGEFVASLQRNVNANPLPVALLGVSLAWLMVKPTGEPKASSDRDWDHSINRRRGFAAEDGDDFDEYEDYPVTVVAGRSMQRLGKSTDEHGQGFSEFTDDAGKKFRATSDAGGNRAGHFTDEAGNLFRGFTDSAGGRVGEFRDEAGNLLDDATGWASHTWQKAKDKLHEAQESAGSHTSAGNKRVGDAASAIQDQLGSLNQSILAQFRDQPLVGGALAFALGAALGSTLPHTPQEDALMGDAADALKDKVGESASDLYDQGKDKAADLYGTAAEKAGELYNEAKQSVSNAVDTPSPSATVENPNQ